MKMLKELYPSCVWDGNGSKFTTASASAQSLKGADFELIILDEVD